MALGFPAAVPALIGYAAAAAGIVTGVLGAVKSTKSVAGKYGASGGGGGQAPKAPSAPAFNLVAGTGSSQISDSIEGQQLTSKAYVVASDVTTGQALDRNIISDSRL